MDKAYVREFTHPQDLWKGATKCYMVVSDQNPPVTWTMKSCLVKRDPCNSLWNHPYNTGGTIPKIQPDQLGFLSRTSCWGYPYFRKHPYWESQPFSISTLFYVGPRISSTIISSLMVVMVVHGCPLIRPPISCRKPTTPSSRDEKKVHVQNHHDNLGKENEKIHPNKSLKINGWKISHGGLVQIMFLF